MKIMWERNSEEMPVEWGKDEPELEEGKSIGRKFRLRAEGQSATLEAQLLL